MRAGNSKFANIVEAIRALRGRKVKITPMVDGEYKAPQEQIGRLTLILTHPVLVEDRDLVREIMALGVDLYKIEKNIQD